MNIETTVQPAVEPVTPGEAFFHLKLSADPSEDVSANPQLGEVMRVVATARQQCEQTTRRAFVAQTLRMTMGPPRRDDGMDRRWLSCSRPWGAIELLRPPLISVESVKYYDDSNVLQTVDPALYFIASGLVARVRFTEEFSNPSVYLREDAIQVEYVAGYAPVPADPEADPPTEIDYRANIPESLKQAVLLEAQLNFDELQPDKRTSLERARDALMSSYKISR